METGRYANDLLTAQYRGENKICVSVIVPLHKQLPQRNQNKLMVKNAINEAKDKLKAGFKEYDTKGLIEKLDQIQSRETFTNGSEGVGLFVSDGVTKMVHFPFEVKRKVIVDFSFEVRDLIFANHRRLDFFALALSNNKTRLFKSLEIGIEEIVNEEFPLSYEEQFQYPENCESTEMVKYAPARVPQLLHIRQILLKGADTSPQLSKLIKTQ